MNSAHFGERAVEMNEVLPDLPPNGEEITPIQINDWWNAVMRELSAEDNRDLDNLVRHYHRKAIEEALKDL